MNCDKCGQKMKHIDIVDQVGTEPVTYSYMTVCEKCEIIHDAKEGFNGHLRQNRP